MAEVSTIAAKENSLRLQIGGELYSALRGGHTVPPVSASYRLLTIDDAYAIALRRCASGRRTVSASSARRSAPRQKPFRTY